MNTYLKILRKAFLICVILGCGGWSSASDNRVNHENVNYMGDLFVYQVGGEGNTNAAQNAQRGKLILAEKQEYKREQRREGKPKLPLLNKNRLRKGKGALSPAERGGEVCTWVWGAPCGNFSQPQPTPCRQGWYEQGNTQRCVDRETGRVLREHQYSYCCDRCDNPEDPGCEDDEPVTDPDDGPRE